MIKDALKRSSKAYLRKNMSYSEPKHIGEIVGKLGSLKSITDEEYNILGKYVFSKSDSKGKELFIKNTKEFKERGENKFYNSTLHKIGINLMNNKTLSEKEYRSIGLDMYNRGDEKTKEALRQHAVRGFGMVNDKFTDNSNLHGIKLLDDYVKYRVNAGNIEKDLYSNIFGKYPKQEKLADKLLNEEFKHNPKNLSGSEIKLPKDTYIVRARGKFTHNNNAINRDYVYSARTVDNKNFSTARDFMDGYAINHKDPEPARIYYLPKGTKIYHPANTSDTNEVVVKGSLLEDVQSMDMEKYITRSNLGLSSFLTTTGLMANEEKFIGNARDSGYSDKEIQEYITNKE